MAAKLKPKQTNASKAARTQKYSKPKLDQIKNSIDEYFKKNPTDRSLKTEATFEGLAENINAFYKEKYNEDDVINAKYIWGIYNNKNKSKNKSKKKIEAMREFLSDFLDREEHPEKYSNPSDQYQLAEEVKPLLENLEKLIDQKSYAPAETQYKNALLIADAKKDTYTKAILDREFSNIIREKYADVEREDSVLSDCLKVFEKYNAVEDIIETKELLAITKAKIGDFDLAEIYAQDCVTHFEDGKDFIGIGSALFISGSVQFTKGQHDKAIEFWDKAIPFGKRLSQDNDETKRDKGILLIARCYHNKLLSNKCLANISEAKSCGLQALPGLRQFGKKEELAALLYQMTEIEFLSGNFRDRKWLEYIKESKEISGESKDHFGLAKCYDLLSGIAYGKGEKALALKLLFDGYAEMNKAEDTQGIAYFMHNFLVFYQSENDIAEATEWFNRLTKFAETNGLNMHLVQAYQEWVDIENDPIKKNEYLTYIVTELWKEHENEQSIARKNGLLVQIAKAYRKQGKVRDALDLLENLARKYEDDKYFAPLAYVTLTIAELAAELGNLGYAYECWQKVDKVITPGRELHEPASIAKLNIGYRMLEAGEYAASQCYLEDAQYLITKFNLGHAEQVNILLRLAESSQNLNGRIEKDFPYLIKRLYEGLEKDPESFGPVLRYWYHKNEKHLYKYFFQLGGLKAVIYDDNISTITKVQQSLSWLFDHFLVAPNESFAQDEVDYIVYPYDTHELDDRFIFGLGRNNEQEPEHLSLEDKVFNALTNPNKKGKLPGYLLFPTEIEGKPTIFLIGRSIGLPSIAYDYMRERTAEEIISGNIFVLNLPRFILGDKFYADMLFCRRLGFIPTYLNTEIVSDSIEIIGKLETKIPFTKVLDRKVSAQAKLAFNELRIVADKTSAQAALNTLQLKFDELFSKKRRKIPATIVLTEIRLAGKRLIYPVIVLHYKATR